MTRQDNEVAKLENIVVENEDIDSYLSFHAELQDKTVADLKKELEAQMQMDVVRSEVLGDKVYKFLAGVNKAENSKMSKQEYEAHKLAEQAKNQAKAQEGEEEKEEKKKSPAKKTTAKATTKTAKATATETEEKPKKTTAKKTTKKKESEEK